MLDVNSSPPPLQLPGRDGTVTALKPFLRSERVILLFVPAGQTAQGQAFLAAARENIAGWTARNLVALVIVPTKSPLLAEQANHLLHVLTDSEGTVGNAYQAGDDRPTFYLIGKDGTVKLAEHDVPTMTDLFLLIDAMPMRQREMGQSR